MKKVFLMFLVSLCFGVISVVVWTGPAYAPPPPINPPIGGLLACQAALNTCNADLGTCDADLGSCTTDLNTCNADFAASQASLNTCNADLGTCNTDLGSCTTDLNACNTDLAACEAGTQVFPGDGAGDGPALSYTDNGDGTFTDNNTKFVWEKKLAADGSDGGDCDEFFQANRSSVHCVNNIYTWTDTGDGDNTNPDGTLFTEFLADLNNSAFASFSDWCIPNLKKLQSIVDYGTFSPASSVPGETAASSAVYYWSATTFAPDDPGNPGNAWGISFGFGVVNTFVTPTSSALAQCVHARD